MEISRIFISVYQQLSKETAAYMYCSSTIKLLVNHWLDSRIAVLECKSIIILKNQNQRFRFFKEYYKTLFYKSELLVLIFKDFIASPYNECMIWIYEHRTFGMESENNRSKLSSSIPIVGSF